LRELPCRFLGLQTGTQKCKTCRGNVRQKVFSCRHPKHKTTTLQHCQSCADYETRDPSRAVANWVVGMTAAPRPSSTLRSTLRSLRRAGWAESVHLFAEEGTHDWLARLGLGPVTS